MAAPKIAILIESDFYEHEIWYYHYRFLEAGYDAQFMSRLWGNDMLTFKGHEYHAPFECRASLESLDDATLDTYAALIVPSGIVSDRLSYTDDLNKMPPAADLLKRAFAKPNLLKGITTDTTNQNTANNILKQWQEASAVADQVGLTQADLTALINQLNADRQLNGDKKQQIADWEKLLPTLQSQLQKAIADAQTAKANTTKEWTEYQTSQDQYQKNLADVLTRRAQLQTQGQLLLHEIDNVDEWVNQQNTLLSDEIGQVQALITQLNAQKAAIPSTLSNDQTLTLKALIDQSLQLLTQKQIVLTAEQSTFTQKQTLLETQKKVIQTQYDLLDAYLENPDKDTTNLEKLLAEHQAKRDRLQKDLAEAGATNESLQRQIEEIQKAILAEEKKRNDIWASLVCPAFGAFGVRHLCIAGAARLDEQTPTRSRHCL
jgi:hypothetical protein